MSAEVMCDVTDLLHQRHCLTCYRMDCTDAVTALCPLIGCDLGCGARYHVCKSDEHRFLCANQKQPCINAIHGCPWILYKSELGAHLETCPASVVLCSMQWNRWPVYTDERKLYSSLVRLPVRFNSGQLDMALAMRDQRMLNKARKVPRRMKRVLRNSITRRYPAVPISYRPCDDEDDESTATSTFSDEEDSQWDLVAMPPGLQRSVCSKLYRAAVEKRLSRATIEEVSPFSSLEDLSEPVQVISELNGSVTCHYLVHTAGEGELETSSDSEQHYDNHTDAEKDASLKIPAANSHTVLCDLLDVDLNLEMIAHYQIKPLSMYTFLCAQLFRRDEYGWHFNNVHNDIHCGLNGWLEQRCPLAQYGCTFSVRRLHPNHHSADVVHSKLLESFGVRPFSSESCTIKKSPSVDSYWNVSSNAPKGHFYSLPNMSQTRLREATPEIYTSYMYEGHVQIVDRGRSLSPPKSTKTAVILTDLPYEILRLIVRYLDGFSLNGLSLTCHLLRDICCSIVERRGIVVCEWQRCHDGGAVQWRQSQKRWQFSKAFSPVRRWCLAELPPISEHLKACPYNVKVDHHNARLLPVHVNDTNVAKLKVTERDALDF